MNPNAMLIEQAKIVVGLGPIAPSTSTPDFISMKGYNRCTIIINQKKTTTVTGSAITLTQATDVSNTAGKTLGFSEAFRALNTGAGGNTDTLSSFTVSSNTFTTDSTNSTEDLYVIELKEHDLDIANNFDCVRVNTGNSVNATLSVTYILWPAKYGKATPPTAITD